MSPLTLVLLSSLFALKSVTSREMSRTTLNNFPSLPGNMDTLFARRISLPVSPDKKVDGGVVVGLPRFDAAPPEQAFIRVPMGDGRTAKVPKGFYGFTETEQEFDGNLQLPRIEDPLSLLSTLFHSGTGLRNKDRAMRGVYFPLPLGLKPVNIQFTSEDTDGVSHGAGIGARQEFPQGRTTNLKAPANPFQRDSLLRNNGGINRGELQQQELIRQHCAVFGKQACDVAIDNYNRAFYFNRLYNPEIVRQPPPRVSSVSSVADDFGTRLMKNLVHLVKRNLKSGRRSRDDAGGGAVRTALTSPKLGALQTGTQNGKSRGLYLDFPGIRPIFLGGFVNNAETKGVNLGFGSG